MGYAFDTNTVIHLMRGTQTVKLNRKKAQDNGEVFHIPPFVNYEMLRGLIIKPIEKHRAAYQVICDNCIINEMTNEIWVRAAEIYADLYSKRFTVRDSDILIAAYCIVNNLTLITNNVNDFMNIDGLLYEDWV